MEKLLVVSHTTDNLSNAYDFAEHRIPDIVLSSASNAERPEFELFSALLSAIGSTSIIFTSDSIVDGASAGEGAPKISRFTGTNIATDILSIHRNTISKSQSNSTLNRHFVNDRLYDLGRILLLGASTGGIDALLRILSDYPRFGPPILIVQHTGKGFSKSLTRLLDNGAKIRVKSAEDSEVLQPGCAYMSPGQDQHLCLARLSPFRCQLSAAEPRGGHRPSIDTLFESAVPHAQRVSAALLTGMGRDGAQGLLALRNAGARTFAQDAESSIIHGMPSAAIRLGAAEKVVGINDMARNLLETCLMHKAAYERG